MPGSFDEYVTQRGAALLRFAYVLCGDRYLAEDLPDLEIAEVLGCRPATMRVHASRGLAGLRRLLTPSNRLTQRVGEDPWTLTT